MTHIELPRRGEQGLPIPGERGMTHGGAIKTHDDDRPPLAARGADAEDALLRSGGEGDGAVGVPPAALTSAGVGQINRLSVGQGHYHQPAPGEEPDRCPVGREEWRVRAIGAWHGDRVELINGSQKQPVTSRRASHVDDAAAIGREFGHWLGSQSRRGRLSYRQRDRGACDRRRRVGARQHPVDQRPNGEHDSRCDAHCCHPRSRCLTIGRHYKRWRHGRRAGSSRLRLDTERGNETIAAPVHGLDVLRARRRITQRLPEHPNGFGQRRFTDERVLPDGIDQLLFGNDSSWPLQHVREDAVCAWRQTHLGAFAREDLVEPIEPERAESHRTVGGCAVEGHGG